MKAFLPSVLATVLAGLTFSALTLLLLGAARPASADVTPVYQFSGRDGNGPTDLIQGKDGNFYGTTADGGTRGYGEVYQLTPEGVLTKLVNFNGKDGSFPTSLLQAADGSFYGTTSEGGASSGDGYGTIFRLTTDGTAAGTKLTTLVNFYTANGYFPLSLLQAADGSFYGTTPAGGAGNGTLFHLTTNGTAAGTTFATLYSFNGDDGSSPTSLLQAADGSFYGTTYVGGTGTGNSSIGNGGAGYGTVFRFTTDGTAAGTTLTTLYQFNGSGPDGANPLAGLLQAQDGSFYGTTLFGSGGSEGSVFRVLTDGTAAGTTLTTLYNFHDTDGDFFYPALLQAANGRFYGTTQGGGNGNHGTLFRLTTDGTAAGTDLTTFYEFNYTDGYAPVALLQAADGSFYGTAASGGGGGYEGLVFHVTSAPTPPPDRIESLTFASPTVASGQSVTGEVTLKDIAVDPVTVLLSVEQGNLTVRSFVVIAPGHRHAYFTAQAGSVQRSTVVTIKATVATTGKTTSAQVTVTP